MPDFLRASNNLTDVADRDAARGNLGATKANPTANRGAKSDGNGNLIDSQIISNSDNVNISVAGTDGKVSQIAIIGGQYGEGFIATTGDGAYRVMLNNEGAFVLSPARTYIELPTEDPHDVGQWWSDNGTVKISAG